MSLNYKRGFIRVYLVLSVAWVAWGLYKPIPDRARSLHGILEIGNRLDKECDAANDKRLKKYQKLIGEYERRQTSFYPPAPSLENCRARLVAMDEFHALKSKRVLDIYRDRGFVALAAFCFVPPFAGGLLLLGGEKVVAWITQGFSRSP